MAYRHRKHTCVRNLYYSRLSASKNNLQKIKLISFSSSFYTPQFSRFALGPKNVSKHIIKKYLQNIKCEMFFITLRSLQKQFFVYIHSIAFHLAGRNDY